MTNFTILSKKSSKVGMIFFRNFYRFSKLSVDLFIYVRSNQSKWQIQNKIKQKVKLNKTWIKMNEKVDIIKKNEKVRSELIRKGEH